MARRRRKKLIRRPQRISTKIKRKASKATGIPLTRSGRKAKIRRLLLPGCLLPVVSVISTITLILLLVYE